MNIIIIVYLEHTRNIFFSLFVDILDIVGYSISVVLFESIFSFPCTGIITYTLFSSTHPTKIISRLSILLF